MNGEDHGRAKQLIDAAAVEGITDSDRGWLDGHLEQCGECAAYAASFDRTVSEVRAVSFPVDPALVATARVRVRLRAHELRDQAARTRALWISCALSWVLGVISAPLLWRAFEWAGGHMGVPALVWQAGFATAWLLPAAVVATWLAWRRSHALNQNGHRIELGHWEH